MEKVRFPLPYLWEFDMLEKNGGIILPHAYNSNISQPMSCQQRFQMCCCTVNVIKDERVSPESFQECISLMLFKGSITFFSPKGYENVCFKPDFTWEREDRSNSIICHFCWVSLMVACFHMGFNISNWVLVILMSLICENPESPMWKVYSSKQQLLPLGTKGSISLITFSAWSTQTTYVVFCLFAFP